MPARSRKRRPGNGRFVLFVGLRYLLSRRETPLHSLANVYAGVGILLGVCALIVVLAVMSGFDEEVRGRIVGTNAHVVLLRYGPHGIAAADSLAGEIAGHPEVLAVAPFVHGKAMLSAGQAAEGAIIKGICWDREIQLGALDAYVERPTERPLLLRRDELAPGIILGRQIAQNLGVFLGDEIILISPAETRRTPLGFVPRMRRFRLCGIFNSGMYEFDASLAYIDQAEAQSFFGLGERVSGLAVRLRDMYRAPSVGQELVERLGGFPYWANNWIEMNENLFAWMRTEKRVMSVILTMIILVAGFSIASSMIMLVTQKRREIGILRSMGASRAVIQRVFIVSGMLMALAGILLGLAAGLGLCYLLGHYQLIRLPEDIYFIDTLPVSVQLADLAGIVGSVLGIALLSTLYPAWRAARLDPVEAIRSE